MKHYAIVSRSIEPAIDSFGKLRDVAVERLECGHIKTKEATKVNLKAKSRICYRNHETLTKEGFRRLMESNADAT